MAEEGEEREEGEAGGGPARHTPQQLGGGRAGLPESGGFLGSEVCLMGGTLNLGGCMGVERWLGMC